MKNKNHPPNRTGCDLRRWFHACALVLTAGVLSSQAGTIAYWQFESGNPSADASGGGHTLSLNNVATATDVAADAPGAGSAVFNGSSSFAQTTAALDLSAVRTLTLEFFAKSTQTSLGMICEHGPDIAFVPGAFYCDFNENGSSFRITQFSSGFNLAYGDAPVRDGDWHHYAATLDNSGGTVAFNLYVDGNLLTSVTRAQGASAPGINDLFNIGSRNGSAFFYNGLLDEMRLSDRVLDPAAFLRNRYTNVTFGILQQPTNTTVLEGDPVTFTVAAAVTNAPAGVLEYQWLREGADIPGATGASYTLHTTSYAGDHNAQFRVRITAAGIFLTDVATSDLATLTVIPDTNPPVALATYAPAANCVTLAFDSALDPVTAVNPGLYTLNGGATVDSVRLAEDRLVVLSVTSLTSPAYTVTFAGVSDPYGNAASGSLVGTNSTGLTFSDVGFVSLPGYVYTTNQTQSVMAATGTDIWGGADGLGFLYTNITGDFDLRVRVENMGGAYNINTRGGLMVREDTSYSGRNIAALTYANAGNWVVTARTTTDGLTTIPGYPPAGLIPRYSPYPNAWLRIVRSGESFRTYYSTNNLDWLTLDGGEIVPAVPFAETLLVGIASSQISVNSPEGSPHALFTYSGFKNFIATEGTIVVTAQPTNTTVLENRSATFFVGATLQGGDSSALRYQWRTNGMDVLGATSPSFTLTGLPQAMSGTQVRCVVSAGPSIAPLASDIAILTVVPDTASPVPASVAALATIATVVFDEVLDSGTANDPARYALDGGFTVLSAALQADGKTVVLRTDGLNSPQFLITCTGIADLAGNAFTGTVAGVLHHAGMTLADIQGGFPTTSFLIQSTPTGFALQSQYGDIWGAADSCAFVYQPMTNDFDVRVQIVGMTVPVGWGRGGLMARVSADADSANLMVGSYREGFATHIWTARATQGGATTFGTAGQNPSFPNVWSRLQRAGSTFTAYHSPDGYHWTQFGRITDLAATETMLVGLGFSTCQLNDPSIGVVQFDHFGPTVSIPQLEIVKSAENVVLRWPASASDFSLQQASELGAGTSWSAITNAPVPADDLLQVTLPISANRYYRLVR